LASPAIDRRTAGWYHGALGIGSPPVDRVGSNTARPSPRCCNQRLGEMVVRSVPSATGSKPLLARQPRPRTTVRLASSSCLPPTSWEDLRGGRNESPTSRESYKISGSCQDCPSQFWGLAACRCLLALWAALLFGCRAVVYNKLFELSNVGSDFRSFQNFGSLTRIWDAPVVVGVGQGSCPRSGFDQSLFLAILLLFCRF
jgi:hypothetical protein